MKASFLIQHFSCPFNFSLDIFLSAAFAWKCNSVFVSTHNIWFIKKVSGALWFHTPDPVFQASIAASKVIPSGSTCFTSAFLFFSTQILSCHSNPLLPNWPTFRFTAWLCKILGWQKERWREVGSSISVTVLPYAVSNYFWNCPVDTMYGVGCWKKWDLTI